MKSDPRLNWHFNSWSRYLSLSRRVSSSSHPLPRSSRRELGLLVSWPTSSSRQLPRSSRRDQTQLHVTIMKSDPRLNWHFDSSSRYSSLSRRVSSSSHPLPRSSRRELGLFVSSPMSSSRQLPRSSRRDQTCRHQVRLVDP